MAIHKRINPFNQHRGMINTIYETPEEQIGILDRRIAEEPVIVVSRKATPVEYIQLGGCPKKVNVAQQMRPEDLTAADEAYLIRHGVTPEQIACLYGMTNQRAC